MRLLEEIKMAILADVDEFGDGTQEALWQRCTMDVPWEPFKQIISRLIDDDLLVNLGTQITLTDSGVELVQQEIN